MGKETELKEMVRTGQRKRIEVVRAKQERTGVMYSDARTLNSPEDVLRTFGNLFENAGVEQVLAVSLTKKCEPVAIQIVAVGGVDFCYVSIAEILKLALLSNSPGILLLHNHPSGNVSPSVEDRNLTERVKEAGRLLEIELVDHIIVGCVDRGYSIKGETEIYIDSDIRKKGA